ncbi:MAG: hypothetical protein ACRDP6_42820 [Actinoallomurus sp.]
MEKDRSKAHLYISEGFEQQHPDMVEPGLEGFKKRFSGFLPLTHESLMVRGLKALNVQTGPGAVVESER